MIGTDIRRACGNTKGWRRISRIIRNPGLQAVLIYRFGSWLRRRSILEKFLFKLPYVFLFYRVRRVWGIEINPEASIGEGFVVYHYGRIFIGEDVVIGKNVSITHGVTIGRRIRGNMLDAPVIGNDVHISPGAVIVGSITIGDHVWIGANAVVEKNVPGYALVHSQPVQFDVMTGNPEASGDWIAEEPADRSYG